MTNGQFSWLILWQYFLFLILLKWSNSIQLNFRTWLKNDFQICFNQILPDGYADVSQYACVCVCVTWIFGNFPNWIIPNNNVILSQFLVFLINWIIPIYWPVPGPMLTLSNIFIWLFLNKTIVFININHGQIWNLFWPNLAHL